MQCISCPERAILQKPSLCKNHFMEYFEEKVRSTIERFKLVTRDQNVAVAVSGGKDSQTVLYLLKKFGYNVTGICIDEGIKGYRSVTMTDLTQFCMRYGIDLKTYSFAEQFSTTIDTIRTTIKEPPCRRCGVLRRYVLNKAAREYDVIATGHNLDDECQSILMNFFKGNLFLAAKIGPKSGIVASKHFTPRVKPLYLCTEREVTLYAYLMKFPIHFRECPYAQEGFRAKIRDALLTYTTESYDCRQNFVEWFLKISPSLKGKKYSTVSTCVQCGEATHSTVCKACEIVEAL